MKNQGKSKNDLSKNKVKNRLAKQLDTNIYTKLGETISQLKDQSSSPQVSSITTVLTEFANAQVKNLLGGVSDSFSKHMKSFKPESQKDVYSTGSFEDQPSKAPDSVTQVDIKHKAPDVGLNSVADAIAALDFSQMQQAVKIDLKQLQTTVPKLIDSLQVSEMYQAVKESVATNLSSVQISHFRRELTALENAAPSISQSLKVEEINDVVTIAGQQLNQLDLAGALKKEADQILVSSPAFVENLGFESISNTIENALPAVDISAVVEDNLNSLTTATPELLNAFSFSNTADLVEQALPAIKRLDTAKIAAGDLTSLHNALPELLSAIDLTELQKSISQNIPALSQLDIAGVMQGDLASLIDTLPDVMHSAGLKNVSIELAKALPALKQLDIKGMAHGDISSLVNVAPKLLNAAGLDQAANVFSNALPAMQQLDLKSLADGDVSSLIEAAPSLFSAFGLNDTSTAISKALPAIQQLNLKNIADGDISSLMQIAPDLFDAVGLDQASEVMSKALPAIEQLNFSHIAQGDISSLIEAAPGLLSAAGFDKLGTTLGNALPALKKLDVNGILSGDINSLLQQAPALLNAFGLQDAAGFVTKHAGLINKLDFNGILKGDLTSISNSMPEILSTIGLDDIGLESLFDDNEPEPKSSKKKKPSANKRRKKRSNRALKKSKSAFRTLESDFVEPAQTQLQKGNNPQNKPTNYKSAKVKQSATNKLLKNSNVMTKSSGWFKGLMKGPMKLLGKASGPINAILGAADVASTLNDDSLTNKEKSSEVGASVGSTVGSTAGMAIGATLGSIIPGFGTAVGGAIGSWVGGLAGEAVGGWLGDGVGSLLYGNNDKASSESNSNRETEQTLSLAPRLSQNNVKDSLSASDNTLSTNVIHFPASQAVQLMSGSNNAQGPLSVATDMKEMAGETDKTSFEHVALNANVVYLQGINRSVEDNDSTSGSKEFAQISAVNTKFNSIERSLATSTSAEGVSQNTTKENPFFESALNFVKDHVINEAGAVLGTMAVIEQFSGAVNKKGKKSRKRKHPKHHKLGDNKKTMRNKKSAKSGFFSKKWHKFRNQSPLEKASSIANYGSHILNVHTVLDALTSKNLNRAEKVDKVGSTLAGAASAEIISSIFGKSKHPLLRAIAPVGAYIANTKISQASNGMFSSLFGLNKDESVKGSQDISILASPEKLNSKPQNKQEHPEAQKQPINMTVNANISVHGTANQKPEDIALEVKRVLEMQQEQALRDVSSRYYNQVA